MTLKEILKDYYKTTGRSWPDFDHAMHFADTEKAEALEIYMSQFTHYLRNHPENKPKCDIGRFEEELGDFLMMIQVAGMAEGCNPIEGLITKLSRKAGKKYVLTIDDAEIHDVPPINPFKQMAYTDTSSFLCKNYNGELRTTYISEFAQQIEERLGIIFRELKLNPADPDVISKCKWIRHSNDFSKTFFVYNGIKLLEYEFTDSGFRIIAPPREVCDTPTA